MTNVILSLIPLLSFILGLFLGRFFATSLSTPKTFRDVFGITKDTSADEQAQQFKTFSPSKKLQEQRLERDLEEEQ